MTGRPPRHRAPGRAVEPGTVRFAVRRHSDVVDPIDGNPEQRHALDPGRPVPTVPIPAATALAAQPPSDHIVYQGRLEIRCAGVDLLLEAWALACPHVPGVLVLAGDGPDEGALRALAGELSIADRVRFVGPVHPAEENRRMAGARVVAIPSRVDPSQAVLAALATGSPVIAFGVPGQARTRIPPGCGRYVQPFDIADFSAALIDTHRARGNVAVAGAVDAPTEPLPSIRPPIPHPARSPSRPAARRPPTPPPTPADDAPTTTIPQVAPQHRAHWATWRPAAASLHLVLAAAIGTAAFTIRAIGLRTANDLFIDELTYTQIATQVADGQWPHQFGTPFFLHPPASFLLNAAVVKALGLHGTDMDLVFDLRWVNAVLGSLTAATLFLVVRRLTTVPVALIAGVVVTFDPFVLRNDSKVMLETPATLPIAAGWLVLLVTFSRPPGRTRGLLEIGAGVLFGLALVTKDLTAIATVVPLVLALAWRQTLRPPTMLRLLLAAAVPYLAFLGAVLLNGLLPAWWAAKQSGFRRLVGLDQQTGFNAPHAPSLLPRLVEQIGRFGTSYFLIGICVFAAAVAVFSPNRARRFIGLVGLSVGAFGAFAVTAGAAEEQIGYYVAIAAVLALAACCADLVDRRPAVRRPLLIGAITFAALTVALGVHARLTLDDGYLQARAWLVVNVPITSPVGLTSVTGEFGLLPRPGYGVWPSLTSLATNKAEYVLTEGGPLSQGYGYSAPELLDWLQAHADPVFDHYGPSKGHVVIWRIRPGTLDRAVADGLGLPPVTGGYP